jgi:hypothetical protein
MLFGTRDLSPNRRSLPLSSLSAPFRKKTAFNLAVLSIFGLIVAIRYGSVLNSFWLGDDTQILKHAISHYPWEFFFSPKIWQELSANNFTPWVSLSFAVDWKLFALNPFGFYLHQLFSLSILSFVSYGLLRLWLTSLPAFLGALLFSVSVPFAESAQQLMVRHYIEGMIFLLLSITFFVKTSSGRRPLLLTFSVVLYLFACAAKEIFVPMIVVLPLLQRGTIRERVFRLLPFLAVSACYVLWRWYMLGRVSGGYGLQISPTDVVFFFPKIANALGDGLGERLDIWRWLIGTSTLASCIVLLYHDRKAAFSICLVAIIVLLPLLPVLPIMSPRHIFLVAFCLPALHSLLWDRLLKKSNSLPIRAVVILWGTLLVIGFVAASSAGFAAQSKVDARQAQEGRFFLKKGDNADLLIDAQSPAWYYDGISWIRQHILSADEGPAVMADTRVLCLDTELTRKYKRIWHTEDGKAGMTSEQTGSFVYKYCNSDKLPPIRENTPLMINLDCHDNTIFWEFGPYKDGTYELLLGKTAAARFPLPIRGSRFYYARDLKLILRLRYTSPEGWITYSPLMGMDITERKGSLQWTR